MQHLPACLHEVSNETAAVYGPSFNRTGRPSKDGSQALGSCHAGFCTQACLRLHLGRKLSDLQTVREQHGEGLAVFMGLGFESPLVKTLGDVSVW